MAQNGKKQDSAPNRKGSSPAHKSSAARRKRTPGNGSAKKQNNSKRFDFQSAIASVTKAIGVSPYDSQDKHGKTVPSDSKKKNTVVKSSESQSAVSSKDNKPVNSEMKIGDRLDTSKMPTRSSTVKFTQYGSTFSRTHQDSEETSVSNKKNSEEKIHSRSNELTFSSFIGEYAKKIWVRILILTLVVFLAIYIVYQLYLNYYTDIQTEIANISTYSETIDTEGIAIRDETQINGQLSGSTVNAVENGEKVSRDQTVINIFNSSQAAAAYKRIAEIDKEISELQSMTTASEDSANVVTNIEKQLDEQVSNLAECVNNGELGQLDDIKGNLTYLFNKRLVAMRKVEDYQDRIDTLNKEKESLESTYSQAPSTINAPSSGYYVNSLDGYENLLNTSMLSELTAEKLDDIMSQEVTVSENSAGKLMKDFSWYLACPVPAKDAEDYLSEGSVYTLVLPYSETGSMQGTLQYLNKADGDKYLAIFRCNSLLSELCTIRRQPVKIQIRSYTGFNIKKSALHVRVTEVEKTDENGNKMTEEVRYPCVYTVVGNQVVAKQVNILYNGDKIVICSSKETGSNYLTLYDEVITEGKGLYAGKIIS